MLQLLALGAVIGAMWAAFQQQSNSSAADGQPQADSEQQQQQREQPSPRLPTPLRDNLAQHQDASSSATTSKSNSNSTPLGRMSHNAKIAVAAVGGLAALAAAAAVSVLIGRRRRHGRSKHALGYAVKFAPWLHTGCTRYCVHEQAAAGGLATPPLPATQ